MAMLKDDNSLRSQGLTVIATDKPTRAKLKALARSKGMYLSDYLRMIADQDQQGALPGIPVKKTNTHVTKADLSQVSDEIAEGVFKRVVAHFSNKGRQLWDDINPMTPEFTEAWGFTAEMLKADIRATKGRLAALINEAKQAGIEVDLENA